MGAIFSAQIRCDGSPAMLGSCSRPAVASDIKAAYSALERRKGDKKLPIVYSGSYNIEFYGVRGSLGSVDRMGIVTSGHIAF